MTYITGICRAYTDYIVQISDEDAERLDLKLGLSVEISPHNVRQLMTQFEGQLIPGGMIPNSLVVAANLGADTAFIGKVANDNIGTLFKNSLSKSGVLFNSAAAMKPEDISGTCITFVTPDGQRSMVHTPGVSDTLEEADVIGHKHELKETDILFSCFPLRSGDLSESFARALRYAPNALIATSLQVIEVMPECSPLVLNRSDIIFGNEDEFPVFIEHAGFKNLSDVADAHPSKILCCTLGKDGAVIFHGETEIKIPVYPAEVVDTTGAGDAFAGGFLYALQKGSCLESAGKIGSYCASRIISQIGARPTEKINLPALNL